MSNYTKNKGLRRAPHLSSAYGDEELRIAERLQEERMKRLNKPFEPPVRKAVTLPTVSIQSKPELERLLEHKLDRKQQAIATIERNKPLLELAIQRLQAGTYPGVVSYSYSRANHCLTVRYVALSVQWYAHRDMMYVQEGNAKKRHAIVDLGTLMHKLSIGRRGFQ